MASVETAAKDSSVRLFFCINFSFYFFVIFRFVLFNLGEGPSIDLAKQSFTPTFLEPLWGDSETIKGYNNIILNFYFRDDTMENYVQDRSVQVDPTVCCSNPSFSIIDAIFFRHLP